MKYASRLGSIAVLGLLVLPLVWLSGSAAARPAPQAQVAPETSSRAAADPIVGTWTLFDQCAETDEGRCWGGPETLASEGKIFPFVMSVTDGTPYVGKAVKFTSGGCLAAGEAWASMTPDPSEPNTDTRRWYTGWLTMYSKTCAKYEDCADGPGIATGSWRLELGTWNPVRQGSRVSEPAWYLYFRGGCAFTTYIPEWFRPVAPEPTKPTTPKPSTPGTPGAADTVAPTVRANALSGRVGQFLNPTYYCSDNSGQTRDTLVIYQGSVKVVDETSGWRSCKGTTYRWKANFRWRVYLPLVRFCIQSVDKAGNKSARSCARITLRR